jgi:hypothetical protein
MRCAAAGKEQIMAANRKMASQADRIRINMNEDYEMSYWTRQC